MISLLCKIFFCLLWYVCFRYFRNVVSYLLLSFLENVFLTLRYVTFNYTTLDCFPFPKTLFLHSSIWSSISLNYFSVDTRVSYSALSRFFSLLPSSDISYLLYFQSFHPVVETIVTGTRSCRILHTVVFHFDFILLVCVFFLRRFRPRAPQIRISDSPSLSVS